jgi:hypothetical protein
MTNHYKIEAFWDQEAQVWVAESSDILGLLTEADNLDRLAHKLKQMITELLAANHQMLIESNKNIAVAIWQGFYSESVKLFNLSS